MSSSSDDLRALYAHRFSTEAESRHDIWEVLCSRFFQKWVAPGATVLDIAAGHCEFVNNIEAGRRIAVDLNPDVVVRAAEGVEAHVARSDELTMIDDASVDVVFISNFFEHVTRETIMATLLEIRRVLKPGGRFLLLQPNVRFCARDYWQFFDHITPIDDRALAEAYAAAGLEIVHLTERFLPYTTKGRLPSGPRLVRLYLAVRPMWRVLGAQTFMVATPSV